MSTKIHACPDALGTAVRLLATGGQAGDSPQALPLLEGLNPGRPTTVTEPAPIVRSIASKPSFPIVPTGWNLPR